MKYPRVMISLLYIVRKASVVLYSISIEITSEYVTEHLIL